MFKKTASIIACLLTVCLSLTACRNSGESASSQITSSQIASSEIASSEIASSDLEQLGAIGSPQDSSDIVRGSFISLAQNGDLFYSAASGGIFRYITENGGLSKIFSGNNYDIFSVNTIDENRICVGFKTDKLDSSYIIFNLKEKTVSNAVSNSDFTGQNIYSLIHYKQNAYFLSTPNRYNRYTLYMQTEQEIKPLASGVDEFFILRDKIFYNVGNAIFTMNPDGSGQQVVYEIQSYDLLGFSVIGDHIFYSNSNGTFSSNLISSNIHTISKNLKVWTATRNKTHAFFCGVNGGIYAYDILSEEIFLVSPYTADKIAVIGDYLYLYPANPKDYPEVLEDEVISGGIYRFLISDLILQKPQDTPADVSSSLSQSEAVSSETAQTEVEPIKPEKFGR